MPGGSGDGDGVTRFPWVMSGSRSDGLMEDGDRRFMLTRVPPPDKAPVQSEAQEIGLVRGLRVSPATSSYRCASCRRMRQEGSPMVHVPDSVQRGDPAWSVEEACRQNAFNGTFSGWCLECAPKQPASETPQARRLDDMHGYVPPTPRRKFPALAVWGAVAILLAAGGYLFVFGVTHAWSDGLVSPVSITIGGVLVVLGGLLGSVKVAKLWDHFAMNHRIACWIDSFNERL